MEYMNKVIRIQPVRNEQLATVHAPASMVEDLNLDYREHPEDLNLGSL